MIAKQEAEQRAKAGTDDFGGFGGFGGAPSAAAAAAGQGEGDDIMDETDSVAKEQVKFIIMYHTIMIAIIYTHHYYVTIYRHHYYVTIYRLLVHLLPLLVLVAWGFPHLMLM